MRSLTRSLRARFFGAFSKAGMFLGILGLAAVSLENLSFGHAHLAVVHVLHHHHLYFGAHEHRPDGQQPGHDHDAPSHQDRSAPRRTSVFPMTPALFQPVAAGVLAAPLMDSTLLVFALALPRALRPALQRVLLRGPPAPTTAPDVCREKGNP